MKKAVPFLDEELIRRDSSATTPAPRRSSAGITRPATSSPKKSGAALRKTAKASAGLSWRPIRNGHCLKINFVGTPDINILPQWRRLLRETNDQGMHQFEFDLRDTTELNLTTLALLMLFKQVHHVNPRDIVLSQCSREVYQVLQWTGLIGEFTVQARQATEPSRPGN